jgi:hypothetical protein
MVCAKLVNSNVATGPVLRESLSLQPAFKPAYIRLPRPGNQCPHTGLSRTAIYGFLKKGLLKSRVIKQPGCRRGIRLVEYESLIAAIETVGVAE